jgi:hypothetical protein
MAITDREQLKITLAKLREPFPPEAHVERPLPGGGKWFYVPWQQIRERIEEVSPDHELEFYPPEFVDAYCAVRCKLVICGVSRIAIGNAENKGGMRGNAIERAVADAYKNAAEAFGVCAYLDDQSKEKRLWTAQYLHDKGDNRAMGEVMRNGDIPGNLNRNKPAATAPKSAATPPKPAPKTSAPVEVADPNLINSDQRKRLFTIATKAGYTKEGVKTLLAAGGIESSADIPRAKYDKICELLADPELAITWNDRAMGQWESTMPVGDRIRAQIKAKAGDAQGLQTIKMSIAMQAEDLSPAIAGALTDQVNSELKKCEVAA